MIAPWLFWILAGVTLVFGTLVVLMRSPVACALSLAVSFIAIGAMFITLEAFFLGVVQILVYAGAVMVLFLFIIMLLDLRKERRKQLNLVAFAGGILVSVLFLHQLTQVLAAFPAGRESFPPIDPEKFDDVRSIGFTLFTSYNLPFQVVAVLLLVATLGVVILSKRELR